MAEKFVEDESHLKERQVLLSEVLAAVKNVQSRFGGKSELATEENPAVRQLCNALQNILQHRIATRGKTYLLHTYVAYTYNTFELRLLPPNA